eukprot:sb/3470491/
MSSPDYITLTTLLDFLVELGDRELTLEALKERVRHYPGFEHLVFPESEHLRALRAIQLVKKRQRMEECHLKFVPEVYGSNEKFYQKRKDSSKQNENYNPTRQRTGPSKENRNVDKALGKTAIAGGVAVAAPYMAGFTSSGVAAGSAAATVQSMIGNVAAGSWFATFQSLGATTFLGTVAAPVLGAVAVVGGVAMLLDNDKKDKK